jgi:hypothetical protein
VSVGTRWCDWKTKPIVRPGTRPHLERLERVAADDDRAGVGRSSAPIRLRSVLLPEPDEPVSETNSPGSTLNETSSSARTRPFLERFRDVDRRRSARRSPSAR